jgi:hypothetical protein
MNYLANTLKTAVFLLVLYIFINSDVFIDRVLPNYTDGRTCTAGGTVTQGVILTISYILISILVNEDYL